MDRRSFIKALMAVVVAPVPFRRTAAITAGDINKATYRYWLQVRNSVHDHAALLTELRRVAKECR